MDKLPRGRADEVLHQNYKQEGKVDNTPERYPKKPIWQWVLIYIVIAAIVYGLIYIFAARY